MKTLAEETKTLRNKSENVTNKISSKPKTSEGPPTLSVEPEPEPERLIPPKEDIDKLV